jgi:hypothetical protein
MLASALAFAAVNCYLSLPRLETPLRNNGGGAAWPQGALGKERNTRVTAAKAPN